VETALLARSATLWHLEGLESDRCRARLFKLCRLLSKFFLDLVPTRFLDRERWEIGRDGVAGQVTCLCQQFTVCHSLLPSYAPTFYDSPSRNESFARLHACSQPSSPETVQRSTARLYRGIISQKAPLSGCQYKRQLWSWVFGFGYTADSFRNP
jgi:hypothetical protein